MILLTLLLSIAYRGWPVLTASESKFESTVEKLESEIEELEAVKASDAEQAGASDAKINQLKLKIEAMNEAKEVVSQPFVSRPPTPNAGAAGIGPALMGSIWVCVGCAVFFLPLGVGTAIFLEEFRPRNRGLRWLSDLLQLNISNLAGVPSIVYGILGVTAFATMFGVFGNYKEPKIEIGADFRRQYLTEGMEVVFIPIESRDEVPTLTDGMVAQNADGEPVTLNIIGEDDDFPEDDATLAVSLLSDDTGGLITDSHWYSFRLPFGRSVLAASLTLMLVILPVVIIATQEALRAVPSSLRQGALGLGCTPWQTVRNVTLPAAIPGIMTGSILAMSRAIGEAAPILMISGIVSISVGPSHLMDDFSILPLQIFYWAGQPLNDDPINFQHVAAGAIIVLLIVLFAFNSVAILIRQIAQKKLS